MTLGRRKYLHLDTIYYMVSLASMTFMDEADCHPPKTITYRQRVLSKGRMIARV